MFICETLEDMQKLYDYTGRALEIHWYAEEDHGFAIIVQ